MSRFFSRIAAIFGRKHVAQVSQSDIVLNKRKSQRQEIWNAYVNAPTYTEARRILTRIIVED